MTRFENTTPALARKWLKHRVQGNRSIDPRHVEWLRRAIERRGYDSSEPISFNLAGALIDGQHRATAISLMPDHFVARVLVWRGPARLELGLAL